MRFKKKYQRGIFLLLLLLIIISGITLVKNIPKDNSFDENTLPVTAVDDAWEDNDDFWNASGIGFGYYSNLIIEGFDNDWYQIHLNPGDTINVFVINFIHSEGNIQLELYDPTYLRRADSYSSNDDEYVVFTADMSGYWRIHVYRDTGSIDQYYDLDIFLGSGDDWMEENDDFWSSRWVDPSYYGGLKMVGFDEDWYHTYLNPGQTIDIFIWFDNAMGNLDLELFDPSNSYREGSHSTSGEESFSFTADVSGDWRIRVYRVSGTEDMHYDLDVMLDMRPGPGDDQFEENDGFWSSAYVDPNWYGDLRIIEEDEDWFHLYLNPGDIIDVAIHFYHEEGNLQLELYDPSFTLRVGSYSSTESYDWSKEKIKFRADMAGDWRIRVYHEDGDSEVHYDMDIWILDDWYENNNYFDEAYFLVDDEYTWLSDIGGLALQENEDWYLIHVTPGFQHLIVNLKFTGLDIINVSLYEWYNGLNWIGSNNSNSMTGDDQLDLEFFSLNPGFYYIHIYGDHNRMEYDLWWDDLRTDFRPDDNYEDNDDPTNAYDLSLFGGLSIESATPLGHISGLGLQYDNDWYQISIFSGRTNLSVLLIYDHQEGPLGMGIYDWDYSEITSEITMRDNQFLNVELPSNGTYYIRIVGEHTGNVYNLIWFARESQTEEMIPGYDILIMLSAIFGVATIITIKLKRSKKQF
jgi:hypothetical protein